MQLLKSLNENDSRIFDQDVNPDAIKLTMAILMNRIISADGKTTPPETKKKLDFFQQEFGLDKAQTDAVFKSINDDVKTIDVNIDALKEAIHNDLKAKAEILKHLNNLIVCDNCENIEYRVFDEIRESLL